MAIQMCYRTQRHLPFECVIAHKDTAHANVLSHAKTRLMQMCYRAQKHIETWPPSPLALSRWGMVWGLVSVYTWSD